MSLAPGEQQKLSEIESRLRRSDPELEMMFVVIGKAAEAEAARRRDAESSARLDEFRTRMSGHRRGPFFLPPDADPPHNAPVGGI